MALIGSITNYGSLQGEVNTYGNSLTGEITDEVTLDGEIVGMRGLKGDKGDQGEPGADGQDGRDGVDGQDGADGFSPIATVSKAGDTATITITDKDGTTTAEVHDGADGQDGSDGADGFSPSASVSKVGHTATITITDKDGTTTAEVYDGSGGGASVFIAEYGVTTYADVKDAYDEDATIICTVDDSGNTAICQLVYFDDANDVFSFAQPVSEGFYLANIASNDTWDDGYFQFASTDTATDLRDGLMSALDWQKLDGIESGAEVNVQSDWNEADNTADDYIKNKPTIPSNTSDLNNDSGFITTETDPTVPSWAKQATKPTYTASEVGALPDTTQIPSNIADGTGTSVETLGDLLAGGALFADGAEFSKKTGNHLVIGGIHVCWGVAEVTPAANAYAETEVTLPYTYSSHPVAFASAQARSGQVRTVSANQSDTQAGNKLYVGIYRSNTTVTNVAWMTIGV